MRNLKPVNSGMKVLRLQGDDLNRQMWLMFEHRGQQSGHYKKYGRFGKVLSFQSATPGGCVGELGK